MQSPTITNNTTVNSIVDLVKLKLSPCMKAIDLVTMRMTEAIEHGSQAYCLANDLSDIDILICVLCLDRSPKEYITDLLDSMHYLIRLELRAWQRKHPEELCYIDEQTKKRTFRCTVNGCFVDIGYGVSRGRTHSYVRYAAVLSSSVKSNNFPTRAIWLRILALAREHGVVQMTRGPRGEKLKAVVFSLLIAACNQLRTPESSESHRDIQFTKWLANMDYLMDQLRENMLCIKPDDGPCGCCFTLENKYHSTSREKLVVISQLDLDEWHGSNLAGNSTIKITELRQFISEIVRREWAFELSPPQPSGFGGLVLALSPGHSSSQGDQGSEEPPPPPPVPGRVPDHQAEEQRFPAEQRFPLPWAKTEFQLRHILVLEDISKLDAIQQAIQTGEYMFYLYYPVDVRQRGVCNRCHYKHIVVCYSCKKEQITLPLDGSWFYGASGQAKLLQEHFWTKKGMCGSCWDCWASGT
jgi:hypothetical protein